MPTDLTEFLTIETAHWNLVFQQEYSGLGTGEGLALDLAPPLWEADVSTVPLFHEDAYATLARLNALRGSVHTFYLYNPAKRGPRSDPKGTILAGSTPLINSIGADRDALTISGLPGAYVLSSGDFISIEYGSPSRQALVQVIEGITASSGGLTGLFKVTPHLRPGVSTSSTLSLINPRAKVKLIPGSLQLENAGALHSRLRFTARQTLNAG